MDPITTAIAAALTAGVTGMSEQAREVGKKIATDAYGALKALIKKKFGDDSKVVKAVTELESEPDFKPNQEALAGRIEQVKASGDPELLQLAKALVEALEKTSDGVKSLAKYNVKIKGSQVGIIGDNAKVKGGMHFGDVHKKFSVKADKIDNITQAEHIGSISQNFGGKKEDK